MSDNFGGPIAPDTQDPWVYLTWARELLASGGLEATQPFTEPFFKLVAARSPSEKDALLGQGKEVFGYLLGTGRDELRRLAKAGATGVHLVPGLVTKEWMAEMVYRPDGDPPFGFLTHTFARPDDAPDFVPVLAHGGRDYYPLRSSLVEAGAVLVPSGIEEYGDDAELFQGLVAYFNKYVQVEDPAVLDLSAGYTMYTHIHDRFPVAPYFRAEGDWAAGKSTWLRTFAHVAYRAILAGGSATSAPIFRIIDRIHGTLVLDEADFDLRDPEWKQILKVLNQGWTQGNPALRAERAGEGEPFDVHAYNPFGPKILASRRAFPDPALESRCLSCTMLPPLHLRADIPLFPDAAFYREALAWRDKLLLWRFRNYLRVQADPRQRIAGVEPRIAANGLVILSAIESPAVRATLEARLRELSQGLKEARHDSYEGLVAQSVVKAWMNAGQPLDHLELKKVTELMIVYHHQRISDRKVGELVRKTLGLKTKEIAGFARVLCPPAEIQALATRYGIELGGLGVPTVRTPMRLPSG